MTVYEAIRQMHELTVQGKSFSFSFMSYSYDKNVSHGPVVVQHAILLPGHRSETTRFSDYLLRYRDLDTYEEKHIWQPLIMSFNGQTVHLE